MAESSGAAAPNLNLTPEEKRVYGQLFRLADSEGVGVVTGEVAVKFFEKTRLESRILGEIWQIADRENVGFLTPAGFGIVLRLIGHGQAGRDPTPELALQPGPLPRFDGISIPGLVPQTTGSPMSAAAAAPLQAQGTGGAGVRIPPLTPEKAAQFASLFERQTLSAGNMLPGEQAKQIFERSGLSNEVLGGIWQLADTEQRGALVLTEFVIAMHLLTSVKLGQMRTLPQVVPAGLYEAATRRPSAIPRQQSPTPAVPPIPAIPRQLSGQAGRRIGSPLGRSQLQQPQQSDWLVSESDKTHFDRFFDELDKGKRGFITGEEAVTFFSQSKLPEDTLAQIWDLADMTSAGRLTKDEFAVAMYLIRQQRSKRDGPNPLPATLPPSLVPPSMRAQARPPTATAAAAAASPFDPPPQPPPLPAQPKPSALDDLFGLDSSPMPAAAPMQAMTTGGSNDPFGSNASPAPASPAKASPTASSFAPFVPSSSFGRTLTVHATGASGSSAGTSFTRTQTLPLQASSPQDDLLGGGDEASKTLSNDTTELANLSNQISSLSKHMQEVQGQRATTQNELNQASVQKKNFEQRLSQLRTLYEKEAKDVRALEEQLTASRNDTKKLQTEMAMIDGTYQDLQAQHRQFAAALQADQQENANLKERIRAVNAQVAALKPQIEKLKSEARQQKGLVAINKKQLATNEAEREKLKAEAESLAKNNEEMARQINASSPASATAAPVASPALSTSSVNNPFFRRTGSTDIMGAFSTPPPPQPPAKTFSDKSFDDVFGPSPVVPAASPAPAPATSAFIPQNTGASTGSASSFATPATSNTPTVSRQATLGLASEPPAPPESRQLNSSLLPFGDMTESLSSSRQVSPPVSRMGHSDTPLGGEISGPPPPLEAAATGQSTATAASGSQKLGGGLDARPTSSGSGPLFKSSLSQDSQQARGHSDSVGDPFSAMDQAKAKEDFESAFASFKSSHPKPAMSSSDSGAGGAGSGSSAGISEPTKGFAAFNTEFPPISELERDDDDSSESDSDNGGFEDDFAPASPNPVTTTAATAGLPRSPTAGAMPAAGIDSATRDLTSPVAGTSSSSVSTAMPQQPQPASAVAASSSADSIFGGGSPIVTPSTGTTADKSESQHPQVSSSSAVAPPLVPAKKSSFDDDMSDDFEGLEDAKEGSTADDDFANISRSALDDYNPVFDSSPPRTRSDDHPAPSAAAAAATVPPPTFGAVESSSFDFVSGSSASLAGGSGIGGGTNGSVAGAAAPSSSLAAAPTSTTIATAADNNHDWDALFAALDEPQAAATTTAASPSSAKAVVSSGGPAAAAAVPGSPGSPGSPGRPAVGRALTEEGLHDDPILKNLTGMGYSRKDAVLALEKYDYNLERAANYLASQS